MATEVLSGFARTEAKAESKDSKDLAVDIDNKMNFAQFMELFCRVASAFHHKLLVREGAQLRRAVEACRLEFSLEVLLDHMSITLISNDGSLTKAASYLSQQEVSTFSAGIKQIGAGSFHSPRSELAEMATVVQSIRDVLRLDGADHAVSKKPKHQLKREGSLVMQGQLSRRPSSNPVEQESSGRSTPSIYASVPQQQTRLEESSKPPPQVVMIREVVMPPTLPADIIQLLEGALKSFNLTNAVNMQMALCALDSCKIRYEEQQSPPKDQSSGALDPPNAEVELFFALQAASVYDSARRDVQALMKYHEAMKLARQLPAQHPGRLLVKSCVGVTLFYIGELALAQQCHQIVLDTRKSAKGADAHHPDKRTAAKTCNSTNRSLVDTATAMNNLACCLSQDQSASSAKCLNNAYLLFKHARQIYADTFGPAHPRVGLITRNLDRVRACQNGVVCDAADALVRGEYAHVIPGSTFQIQAFEFVAKPLKSASSKGSKSGGKKKKKGAK
ncbi:unnamed protein product [Phytophthora lilii]|uniref:Unnamed protein product n=1 Tax=Phytophthora lilii TaxID=2077276 RepID=A0A9W6TFW0_9STRA|nr:unnamed protein product [Phytophthora lilii]